MIFLTASTQPVQKNNDTNITVSGCTFSELEAATNSELQGTNLYCWLKANKLSFNAAKTEFTVVIGSRQKLRVEGCSELNIKLDNQAFSS